MKKIGLAITFLLAFVGISHAQQTSMFNYQVQKDSTNYEIQMQLHQPDQVQFIEIYFMEKDYELAAEAASLNQKRDGKYYLAYNGREKRVDPGNMFLTFSHDFGLLREHTLLIKLMDKEFNQLDTQKHPVFGY